MKFNVNKRGVGKTLKQWATLGFVPKRGRKGELRYGNRGELSRGKKPRLYFDPEDVKEDKEAAMDLYNKLMQPLVNHNLRGLTMDQMIKIGKRPKRGYEGHRRKRFAGAQDHAVRLAREMNRQRRAEREAERREKEERQRIAEEFRESRCTRYQWARRGRVANKGAKFEWGSRLNQAIKDEDVYQFGNRYMYCHIDDTHDANADEMSDWEEFFQLEKGAADFFELRSRLIDLCPEYQPFRKSLLASWEQEQLGTWWG